MLIDERTAGHSKAWGGDEPAAEGDGDELIDNGLPDIGRGTSVGKALAVIDALVGGPPTLGVTEVAQRAGIAKSTAFRLLAILAEQHIVERRGDRYALGKKLFEFGNRVIFCRPNGLRELALPHMIELLSNAAGTTVQLAMLDGSEVFYIEKLYGLNHVRSPSHVGSRLPASVTALGKAILAFSSGAVQQRAADNLHRMTPYSVVMRSHFLRELDQIREDGYALDREEASLGLSCIAAPIVVGGRTIAALSVGNQSSRDPLAYRSVVRSVAARIAQEVRSGVHVDF